MAQVVYTSIQRIEDLADARWWAGNQSSYTITKKLAEKMSDNILLIGHKCKLGLVQLCYAGDGRRDDFNYLRGAGWSIVNASHVALAVFFSRKYKSRPSVEPLRPFFLTIDEDVAEKSLRSLVALDCGTNGSAEEVLLSVLCIGECLSALGIEFGDWRFIPMMNSFSGSATEGL